MAPIKTILINHGSEEKVSDMPDGQEPEAAGVCASTPAPATSAVTPAEPVRSLLLEEREADFPGARTLRQLAEEQRAFLATVPQPLYALKDCEHDR